MRRMLEELFYGNIDPNNKQIVRGTRYDEATHIVAETEEKLLKLLGGVEKSLFIENAGAQSEIIAIMALENFIGGFRLGARMAAEVFGDEDGCLKEIGN